MTLPPLKGLLPLHPARTYPPVGRCIYCGSTVALSDEHVVPLGLGGRFVLPDASCSDCSEKTSKFERTCQRTMYGPLRLLYGLPTRRKKGRPQTLRLKVKHAPDKDWEYLPVPQERYPFLITFPYLGMPGILTGLPKTAAAAAVTKRLWIRGASPSHDFHALLEKLVAELGVHSIMPVAKADVEAFCRLLAKIAYSFAVAELGGHPFESPLIGYASGGDLSHCLHYIGSREAEEPPTETLHDLAVLNGPPSAPLVVRIRLLSRLGTPTYYAVVRETTGRANPSLKPPDTSLPVSAP